MHPGNRRLKEVAFNESRLTHTKVKRPNQCT